MIQRVQTIYLLLVIIFLGLVSVGPELVSFVGPDSRFAFSAYGISEYDLASNKLINTQFFPVFIGTIALTLLSFICLMSYKDLKKQFKLGRTIFFLYLLMLISLILLAYFGDSMLAIKESKRELGLGFVLFVLGFPFTFLANLGIKRDKALLDSLNRLR